MRHSQKKHLTPENTRLKNEQDRERYKQELLD